MKMTIVNWMNSESKSNINSITLCSEWPGVCAAAKMCAENYNNYNVNYVSRGAQTRHIASNFCS